jgi:hypothetical protein
VLSAQTAIITAKVLDRATDGSVIQGKYVYPKVEIASGEAASLHIGEVYSSTGTAATERKLGFVLTIQVTLGGDEIAYSGEASSTVLTGVSDTGFSTHCAEAVFEGTVASGEVIDLWVKGPAGDFEALSLHFVEQAAAIEAVEPAVN